MRGFLQQYEFNTLKEKESIYNYELYFKKNNMCPILY